jgi:hypothetical protein
MKKSKMKAWVKALRSGKFKQATGALIATEEDDDGNCLGQLGHCCLGVLAQTSRVAKFKLIGTELLPHDTLNRCGIRTNDGQPLDENGIEFTIKGEKKYFESLAVANDEGITFKRIAPVDRKELQASVVSRSEF